MVSSKDIDAHGLTRAQAEEIENKVREGFGRRLYAAILRKGITQAEAARLAGIGRHNITNYVTGRAMPTELSLQKLAKALGMNQEELLPSDAFAAAAATEAPAKDVWSIISADGDRARVVLDKVVHKSTAAKIGQLIADDPKAPD